MALFLKGRLAGFHKAGTSECVKDTFRFYQSQGNKLTFL